MVVGSRIEAFSLVAMLRIFILTVFLELPYITFVNSMSLISSLEARSNMPSNITFR
nr:hypothetical protein Iba_chr03bCG11520 [Ipomoea batatas]GMC74531.1 hypothetical protein Iba_chr03cCG11140 [Ipomoea batatas]GMC76443.1 hypothetical protein Iba_chr03eCG1230 [Ipomoea batatas]